MQIIPRTTKQTLCRDCPLLCDTGKLFIFIVDTFCFYKKVYILFATRFSSRCNLKLLLDPHKQQCRSKKPHDMILDKQNWNSKPKESEEFTGNEVERQCLQTCRSLDIPMSQKFVTDPEMNDFVLGDTYFSRKKKELFHCEIILKLFLNVAVLTYSVFLF